jgi:hypothetical protein
MNDAAKQIVVAVAAASAAALVAGLLTHYLTKQATLESVSKGTTPLPASATPTTTSSTPLVATPTTTTATTATTIEKMAEIAKSLPQPRNLNENEGQALPVPEHVYQFLDPNSALMQSI